MGYLKATDHKGNIFVMHAERNMSKLMFDNGKKPPHLRYKIELIEGAETFEEADAIARGTASTEKTSKGKGKKQDEQ